MAKRLIDADALMEKAQRFEYQCDDEGTLFDSFQYIDPEDVEKAPTVDAVEVVHGVWKQKQTNALFLWRLECSICGKDYHAQVGYNYCPYCGAKMDGERKDDGI